jgi:hypothetical protein
VQHVLAAGYGLGPACVACEIGGHKRKPAAGLGPAIPQHGAYIAFALQVPYRGPHLMAGREKLHDGVAANKT